ncbi:MAG: hypothetical protein CME36_12415 [unclassified Hahellaceae]|nr:hypothetical protein [Hahellaceae bacterium]|tara:strand:+ start:83472 stop:84686 length:1215 start_codon:yes stop_codon:yes gene_type:complete
MKVSSYRFADAKWQPELPGPVAATGTPFAGAPRRHLVLCFGAFRTVQEAGGLELLRQHFPHAYLVGCSTAGEIAGKRVRNRGVTLVSLEFDATDLACEILPLHGENTGETESRSLITSLYEKASEDRPLRHIILLSDAQHVSGAGLVSGIEAALSSQPSRVTITGGLAGDNGRFGRSDVWCDAPPPAAQMCAIGFYGHQLQVGIGLEGGWMALGASRKVTRASGNTLYELDDRQALDIYRDYLGEYFSGLPKTGLLFPLLVTPVDGAPVIRALVAVDNEKASMTYAGDIAEGSKARLMTAGLEGLVGAAGIAADTALASAMIPKDFAGDSFALAVSCYARRAALGQRTDEELEAIGAGLPDRCTVAGFYSYGEIGRDPRHDLDRAGTGLHNQTMAITLLAEKDL